MIDDELFTPVILPEIDVPTDVEDCLREEIGHHRSRLVWAEGYEDASLMVVLDNPGAREDLAGVPFVCGTRQTLQRGLREAGVSLEDVLVTYILKYRPTRAYDKPAARGKCMPLLDRQLAEWNPRLVLCLGNVAVQAFLGDDEADVKMLRGRWIEGRGNEADNNEVESYLTRVSYHPLAVRRRPNLYGLFLEDCRAVAEKLGSRYSVGN